MTAGRVARTPQPAAEDRRAGRDRARTRIRWGAAITAAFVVTLVRPVSWAIGLAGFLAGGGVLVVAWPIVVLPTPTGLQNALGGPVSSMVFGAPSAALLTMLVGGLVVGLALVLVGVLAGAWAERQGIAVTLEAAAEEGILADAPDLAGAPGAGRIAIVRLLSLAPTVAAALLAWRTLYDVTYRELILPDDLVTPLPLRVLGEVPWVVLGIAAVWLLSDAAAAVGVRRLVLERRPVLVAWLLGWADLLRRPHRILATALTGVGVLLLAAGPGLIAASIGWDRVREVIVDGRDPLTVLTAVLIWVAIWLGALILAGVGAAFRMASWTLEGTRRGGTSPT